MNTYIGTKIVKAIPMDRLAYNQYRGWNLPEDEAGSDEGYLVEYLDGGKPNHASHKGYISWSPKEQFDAAYVNAGNVDGLLPYQVRLVAEKAELDDRAQKLKSFLDGFAFDLVSRDEFDRMHRQLAVMQKYSEVLGERIQSFQSIQADMKQATDEDELSLPKPAPWAIKALEMIADKEST